MGRLQALALRLCYTRQVSSARFSALAGLLGVGATLVLTHPLAFGLRTTVLDDGTLDAFQFLWNIWWARESLLGLGTNPFHTPYLFYPDGVGVLFHTLSLSLGIVSIPLQLTVGLVAAHNLLVLAAPVLGVVAAGLLAREVTGDAWAALVAGLVASVNAVSVWFLPILYLNCVYLIAFMLWAWLRLQATRRAPWVLATLVLTAGLLFASQEYAFMALALLALDTAGRLVAPERLGLARPWLAGTLAYWTLAAAGLGTLALLAVGESAAPPPPLQMRWASGYLSGFVSPPWLLPPDRQFWSILYLGTGPLLLLAPALWLGDRPTRMWAIALVATLAMALGPTIHLTHPLGPDMNAPPTALEQGGVPGPYALALELAPILRFFRAPYRWMAAAHIALAVVIACGLAAWRGRRPGRRRGLVVASLLVAIPALAALDVRGLRAPIVDARLPLAYHILQGDPEPAAILELPSGLGSGFSLLSSRWMYYQTVHRKFLLDGTVSRLPAGREPLVEREFRSFEDLPYVKYVIIHRDVLGRVLPASRRQVEAIETVLAAEGAERITPVGRTEIYRLRTFRPESVRGR